MENDQLIRRIAFASMRGMNRLMAEELLARTGDEMRFFDMTESQLSSVMMTRSRLFSDDYRRRVLERARREADFLASTPSVRPLYFTDADYPKRLAVADDAPLMLYSCGNADLNRGRMVSVVGTRHATPYGVDFVNHLVADLAEMMQDPLTVVSGLAFGIDAAAHSASLKNKVPTVGVLAHGLHMIYPAQHRSLAADMVRNGGGLLTEFGSSDAIHKGNFVARNRIVAAMSDLTIVAESAKKGGALITARLAYDYGRDVAALPGRSSDRYSSGCNALIANNMAALIESAEDVLKLMGWPEAEVVEQQPSLFVELGDDEQKIVDFLTEKGAGTINQLSVATNINVGKIMSILIDMEFKGLVLNFPGGKYRLA